MCAWAATWRLTRAASGTSPGLLRTPNGKAATLKPDARAAATRRSACRTPASALTGTSGPAPVARGAAATPPSCVAVLASNFDTSRSPASAATTGLVEAGPSIPIPRGGLISTVACRDILRGSAPRAQQTSGSCSPTRRAVRCPPSSGRSSRNSPWGWASESRKLKEAMRPVVSSSGQSPPSNRGSKVASRPLSRSTDATGAVKHRRPGQSRGCVGNRPERGNARSETDLRTKRILAGQQYQCPKCPKVGNRLSDTR